MHMISVKLHLQKWFWFCSLYRGSRWCPPQPNQLLFVRPTFLRLLSSQEEFRRLWRLSGGRTWWCV